MGQYTPAVIVHDLAPPRHEWPEWIRALQSASHGNHLRFVACDTRPRELTNSHVDLELYRQARRQVLDDVSTNKLAALTGVGSRSIKRILDALRLERDVYTRRRAVK